MSKKLSPKQLKKALEYNYVRPFSTIQELLTIARDTNPDREAILYKENRQEKSVTYRQFKDMTVFLGTAFKELGLDKSHIACIGENSFHWILSYLTVLGSEGVFVPIDKLIEDEAILNLLNHSESEALIFSGDRYAEIIRNNREKLSGVKYFINMDIEENTDEFLSLRRLVRRGEELVKAGDNSYEQMKSDPNALKMLVYTSGTTGNPKGVMLSEHNLVSSVYYGMHVCTVHTKCLSVLPYHHTYEAVCGILVGLYDNVTICINGSLRTVLPNLQHYKPDYIYLVPAFVEVFYKRIWDTAEKTGKAKMLRVLIKLSNALRKCGIDLRKKLFTSVTKNFGGNLEKIVCGGAPLRAEVGDFFEAIGIALMNGYGISECSPLVSVNRDQISDPSTVGYPLPCLEVKIDAPDEDGNGEIMVKGDVVMLGYYKMPEETAAVLQDGWFRTGDFGHFTEIGQIVITGRKKNIIILANGKNVYPEEIEDAIMSIPYVKEVIVSEYIRSEEGEKQGLSAEVFLDAEKLEAMGIENAEKKIKEDVDALCDTMPPYKKITRVVVRDTEFAKTTSNKIKRTYTK